MSSCGLKYELATRNLLAALEGIVDRWIDHSELARVTGMVVPAYFSDRPTDDMVRHLLWVTLGDCAAYLPLSNIWVVVDGDPRTARVLEEVRGRLWRDHGCAFSTMAVPENHGKLWALKEGVTALLEANPSVGYVVIRDGDGDHAVADMPSLVRAAMLLSEARPDALGEDGSWLIVIGSRRSRHRPMGWVRGELEALLDQVTLDALAYRLAREGRALDLSHCAWRERVPDLSSGYKVYGRQCALELFVRHQPRYVSLSEHDYWRYGPETVTIIEGLLQGAIIAEVPRFTWDGQPTTSFGEYRYVSLYGELLAWVYARLEIPLGVAAQLYDNYAANMTLKATSEGGETLVALRHYALEKVRAFRGEGGDIPPPGPMVPFL